MFYLTIVNKILRHCHSWLARQYKVAHLSTEEGWSVVKCICVEHHYFMCLLIYYEHKGVTALCSGARHSTVSTREGPSRHN